LAPVGPDPHVQVTALQFGVDLIHEGFSGEAAGTNSVSDRRAAAAINSGLGRSRTFR
jgi:hypothetical protein